MMKYERYQKFRQEIYQMLDKTKNATFEIFLANYFSFQLSLTGWTILS